MRPGDEQRSSTAVRGAESEFEIRWDDAAAFARYRLRHELRSWPPEAIEDLVQESLVRLLRVVRREPIDNLEALMTEIARRTAVDALRRKIRWSAVVEPVRAPEDFADHASLAAELGDPLDRLRFVVVEFFGTGESGCRELAIAYFDEQDWKVVAAARGRSHDAVRKQWSRCLELLRAAAREQQGPLMDWSR